MTSKVLASVQIVVGAAASIFALLVAFGVHITPDQWTAISGVFGPLVALFGVWFHPSVPVGAKP